MLFRSSGVLAYPAVTNNGLYVSPIYAADNVSLRAQLKFMYQPLQQRSLGHGNWVAAGFSPISRRLYAIAIPQSNNNYGETHIDIDGPWR